MPYELKEGQGSLFSQPSAEVLGKGEILVDGQKHWVYVLQEFDRDGKPKFALLSESGFKGRLFFNPQEEKQNPASSDFGGYITLNNIDYIEDDSNLSNDFDRNYLRNEIFPMLERKWNNFPNRINNFSKIIKDRNNSYSYLMHEKYNDLITNSIDLKKLRELSNPVISDVLRYSIKKCNIAAPNSKIIEEIIKTFVNSNPGPKSKVEWSRSDKEEASGQITYTNGHILISKR